MLMLVTFILMVVMKRTLCTGILATDPSTIFVKFVPYTGMASEAAGRERQGQQVGGYLLYEINSKRNV